MSIEINLYHHSDPGYDADLKDQLIRIQSRLALIEQKVYQMSLNLDDLISKVSAIETVDASVIALLGELKKDLDDAISKLPTDADVTALNDLSARLGTQAEALAQAVQENTPAEPAV